MTLGVIPGEVGDGRFGYPEMNVSNVQDDLVLAQFSNEEPLISVR